jgi:TonB-linked SusC/RagA family outer membrane protein
MMMMRNAIIVLLISIFQVLALLSYSQPTQVSLKMKNVTIKEVLSEIENQSEYYFLYNSKLINLSRKVDISVINVEISDILTQLFGNNEVNIQIKDRHIVLTPSEESNLPAITISGKISNTYGWPLPGVTVAVNNTNKGTLTDANGRYTISVSPSDSTLIFSFVGMISQEIKIGKRNVIDLTLSESTIRIAEVVVTALGIKREKKALGYSVAIVKNAELVQANETNVINSLAGKVAGVEINSSSAQVGSSAKIVIRGNSSFGDNQPLFVVDGIPFDNSEVDGITDKITEGPDGSTGIDLDPNNIENISVLKGVAASALYGSKAAAGVILITTKNGTIGAPKVNYNYKFGIDDFYEIPLQKSWAQGEFVGKAREPQMPMYYDGITRKTQNSWGPRIVDIDGAVNFGKDRWDVFKMGNRSEHNFNISGGDEKINYYSSVSRLDQQGLLDPINLSRTNILAKFRADVTPWLNASISMNYIKTNNQTLYEGMNGAYSFMNNFMLTPNSYNPYPIFDENGIMRSPDTGNYNNYLWILKNTKRTKVRDRFVPTAAITIKFKDELTLTSRFGLDYYNNFQDEFANNTSGRSGQTGIYEMQTNKFSNFNSDIMLNYKRKLGHKFSVDAMLGHNAQYQTSNSNIIRGSDFIISNFANISNTRTQNNVVNTTKISSVSVYGQLVMEFDKMLYYTFSGRNDWASTLAHENRSYFYPSNSLGFIFSELFECSIIDFGKLRASYAMAGISPSPYQTYTKYVPASGGGLSFPYNGVSSYMLGGSAGNSGLHPEKTYETSLGLEMIFFNNRFGFEATAYQKISRNQLVWGDVSDATGITGTTMNIGELENKGIELMLFGTPVKTKYFSWDICANYSANRNIVNKVSDQLDMIQLAYGLVLEKGFSFPSINLVKLLDDGKGNMLVWDDPKDLKYGYYIRSNHVYSGYTKPSGKIEPDWYGNLRNTLNYKSFSLSALITMKFGGKVNNMNEQYLVPAGMSVKTEERTSDNTIVWPGVFAHLDENGQLVITNIQNNVTVDYLNSYSGVQGYRLTSDLKMQSSDYVKIKELTLQYTVPQHIISKIGFIKGLNISLTGNNIWRHLSDDYTGADPDNSLNGISNGSGLAVWMFPATKSYTLGVGITL